MPTCRHGILTVLLLAAVMLAGPEPALANMAARQFFTPATGAGALSAAGTDHLRVREISLSLDFRSAGRGPSTAEYLLENLDREAAWEDELVFVASATTVTVTVDGDAADLTPHGREIVRSPALLTALGPDMRAHSFRVHLHPGQQRRIVITFFCAPGKLESNQRYARQDGLTRLEVIHRSEPTLAQLFFSYPLWPAYGFAGGTGEMAITVLASQGATPPEGTAALNWAQQALSPGETRWTIRLPGARSAAEAPMREVVVRYAQPRRSPWNLGASAFAGARFAGRNEPVAAAHLALSADLIVDRIGAFMLAGETSFARSVSVSLAFQRGPVSPFLSAYLGGAALATVGPELTPGFELRAGARLVWLPLDVAFQVHPWVTPGEGHVARWRLIVGERVGMW